jgi:hypothetical protein
VATNCLFSGKGLVDNNKMALVCGIKMTKYGNKMTLVSGTRMTKNIIANHFGNIIAYQIKEDRSIESTTFMGKCMVLI